MTSSSFETRAEQLTKHRFALNTPLKDVLESDSDGARFWKKQLPNTEFRNDFYATLSTFLPSNDEIIFYESMSGARVMDNPYAIYDYLHSDSLAEPKIHVWSVSDTNVIPDKITKNDNVYFVKRHTPQYMYLLAVAGKVVSNSVLPEYFVRKKHQKYLNTWHGIGYKRLGRSTHNLLGARKSVTNMLQATHIISPCSFMTNTLLDGFSLRNIFSGDLAQTGYPRIDTTLKFINSKSSTLESLLQLKNALPTILYAPTWRAGETAQTEQITQLRVDLDMLSELNANIIFLGHHIMLSKIDLSEFDNVIIPPKNANTNELLSVADILITDYSSIFFDFLITGKPVVHYLYDYAEYSQNRGLTLDLDELPGTVTFDQSGLKNALLDSLTKTTDQTENYKRAVQRFCPLEDGKATQRVVDWAFNGAVADIFLMKKDTRSRVVFWGGHLTDSEELENFLQQIRDTVVQGEKQVTLVVSSSAERSKKLKEMLSEIGDLVSVVVRSNYEVAMTEAEAEARTKDPSKRSEYDNDLYENMYRREYSRLFGDSSFNEIVYYQNISFFWKKLGSFAVKA